MTPATRLQNKSIKKALEYLDNGDHVFLESPTGSGKSRQFSKVAQAEAEKGHKVLILTDRQNLIGQAARNIDKWSNSSVKTSTGMDGKVDQSGDVVICTVQTARALKDELANYDRIVIDEAHHATANNTEFADVVDSIKKRNPSVQLMGVSATPPDDRSELIDELAKAQRITITFEEAIKAKLIDLPRTITPQINFASGKTVSSLVDEARRKSGTDADLTGLSKALEKERGADWPEQEVYYMDRYLGERRTLCYFDTKKEAEAFLKEARDQGHDVDIVHSGRPKKANEAAIEAFNQGRLKRLLSIDMISEGYDVDAEGVLLAKKTTSKKEYRQILGRAARSYGSDKENKSVLVDLGASTYMHGEINAQAEINNIRGKLDTQVISAEDLLPEKSCGKNPIWVPVKTEKTQAYATAIDGQLIYVVPMNDRYAAFASFNGKKGHQFEMLAIDGERKGMPSRDGFSRWAEDAVRRNERHLARLVSPTSTDRLEHLVTKDFSRVATSIDRNLEMISRFMPPAHQIQAMQAQQRALA